MRGRTDTQNRRKSLGTRLASYLAVMAFAETALVLLRLLISGIIGLIVLFTNGYVRVPKYTLVSQGCGLRD